MKLNKNFAQIGTTALITSSIFVGYMAVSKEDKLTIALLQSDPASAAIDWTTEAKPLMNEYLETKLMYVKYSENNIEKIDKLKGFVFSAEHIREIVSANKSRHGNPDKVAFFFGKDGEFQDGSGIFDPKRPNIHIIAVGIKNNELLIDDASGLELESVFDKAEPCPPKCPK